MDLSSTNALIIVDMQNDYCSDGSVPVAGAAALVKTLSDLSRRVMSRGGRVLVTQDWHTDKHLSFSENGGTWPQHCVQGTKGAELHSESELAGRFIGDKKERRSQDRGAVGLYRIEVFKNPAVILGRARLYSRCSDRTDRTRNCTRGQLAGFHHVCG